VQPVAERGGSDQALLRLVRSLPRGEFDFHIALPGESPLGAIERGNLSIGRVCAGSVKAIERGFERIEFAKRGSEIEGFTRCCPVLSESLSEFSRGLPPINRMDGAVQYAKERCPVHTHIAEQVVLIGNVEGVIFGMPGDIAAAPTHRVIVAFGAICIRHRRAKHVER